MLGSERPLWNTSSLCAKEDALVQALVTAISKAFAFSRRRFVHFSYVSLASPWCWRTFCWLFLDFAASSNFVFSAVGRHFVSAALDGRRLCFHAVLQFAVNFGEAFVVR